MGVFEVTLKTHSRDDITNRFQNLNNCIVHHRKPTIYRIVSGKKKYVDFIAVCEHDDCGKITDEERSIEAVWNKWNPK